ncbi:MAG: hypothetical protein D6712_06590 [Chloroflexi bacterium]|nr:MAG: hypothetical protein D6712_06590 [Chloroflexota bacterium]
MSADFVAKILHVTLNITGADRGLAVAPDLQLIEAINLTQETIDTPAFRTLVEDSLRQAIETGEPVITNNMVTNPENAPVTNTTFSELRAVVTFPVSDMGAVYLDQRLRYGIIDRNTLDKVIAFIENVLENNQQSLSEAELIALYRQINAES